MIVKNIQYTITIPYLIPLCEDMIKEIEKERNVKRAMKEGRRIVSYGVIKIGGDTMEVIVNLE